MNDFKQQQKLSPREKELRCEMTFRGMGECWHVFTPEGFPVIFSTKEDFKAGMSLIAICAKTFPDIKVLTFEIMSNHLHLVLAGPENRIRQFFAMLKGYLRRYLKGIGRPVDLSSWNCSLKRIMDLKYMREVIVYTNRNGYLVSQDATPFNYPWGANRFFFNPELRAFHLSTRERLTLRVIREMFHTRMLDSYNGMEIVDGYVTPACFCVIKTAEDMFRDAHQYFFKLTRDVESQKTIAAELGERVFYTDEELYSLVYSKCRTEFKADSPSQLSSDEKIRMAKTLHYEYNSDNAQVARILRLDNSIVNSLFPRGADGPR